jgi:hypothetical protein
MVYMLMIYSREADWTSQSPEAMQRTMEAHKALEDEMRAAGKYRGGGGLALIDSATTVRYRGGKPTIMDGPFAETKEQLGGFYMVEAENLDEALAYAQRIPGVSERCIEVRPFMHFSPE